jgi:hypothetical protein
MCPGMIFSCQSTRRVIEDHLKAHMQLGITSVSGCVSMEEDKEKLKLSARPEGRVDKKAGLLKLLVCDIEFDLIGVGFELGGVHSAGAGWQSTECAGHFCPQAI